LIDTIVKYNDNSLSVLKIGRNLKIVGGIPPVLIDTFSTVSDEKISSETLKVDSNSIAKNKIILDTIISHSVLANESLYSISQRFMVSIDELKEINDLS
jgi:LysM repeat protein